MSTADNRVSGARNIGTSASISNRVGPTDPEDLFRFNLSQRRNVSLNLSGLSRRINVDIELYKFVRPVNQITKAVSRVDFRRLRSRDRNANFTFVAASRKGGNQAENLSTTLESGDYLIRVVQRQGNSRYILRTTDAPVPGGPGDGGNNGNNGGGGNPIPPEDTTPGNSRARAFNLAVPTEQPQTGGVSDSDPQDYYKLTATNAGDYKFTLSGLDSNASLELLDSNGNIVKASRNAGFADEALIQPLNAGQEYFVRVLQDGGGNNTLYSLNVAALSDRFTGRYDNGTGTPIDLNAINDPNDPNSPPNLAIGTTVQLPQNYVVAEGVNSPEDFFTFTISNRAYVSVETRGFYSNLNLQLFKTGTTPESGLNGNRPGNSAENFAGTLDPGQYFIRVLPGEAGAGSEYSMTIGLREARDIPSITRDIRFGARGSDATNLIEVNGKTFFSATEENQIGLWVSDGTLDGTKRVRSFSSPLTNLVSTDSYLFFVTSDGDSGSELWRSDGTEAGTTMVLTQSGQELNPNSGIGSNPSKLTAVGDRVYFLASPTGSADIRLYRTSLNGTTLEEITAFEQEGEMAGVDTDRDGITDTLFLSALGSSTSIGAGRGAELWRIRDAHTATPGPLEIADLTNLSGNPQDREQSGSNPELFTWVTASGSNPANDRLFISGFMPGLSTDMLIRVDSFGLAPQTTVFGANGFDPAIPSDMLTVGNDLYLVAEAAAPNGGTKLGRELVKIANAATVTGSTQGYIDDQHEVFDINAGGSAFTEGDPANLVAFQGQVYFTADDGNGVDLWRLVTQNGVTTPSKLRSLPGITLGTNPMKLTVVGEGANQRLYFVAEDAAHGRELWVTDGTAQGTRVFDIRPGTESSNPDELTTIAGRLFFTADNGVDGQEVWSI
jgi:ELWxxDGT repeat protein